MYTSESGRDLVTGTTVRLDFTDDGRLVANAGCNTISGAVDTADGALAVADLTTTEMGCAGPLHSQDEWLAAFLGGSPAWRVDGERLVLSGEGAELVFGREKTPPLQGTVWVVDSIREGDMVSSVTERATVEFGADTVTVDTGCNSGSAGYQVSGGTIVFEQLVLTKMACPPGPAAQEQDLVAVLDGEAELAVDGTTITINKNGKGVWLKAG
ncbi:META domain-containing protein [Actinokineospora guangxiensis]|uniref:META domain-containing protein n=1 Tax=Actinokineospora guangxiensis TaxID=1490288 RepID=A0ABW0ESW0_9PSEU